MSAWSVAALLVGAGLGTYLLRYLPMRWYVALQVLFQRPLFERVLGALGPAAIVALLVVSLVGLTDDSSSWGWQAAELRIFLALMVMVSSHLWLKSTITTTFLGVVSYGIVLFLQG